MSVFVLGTIALVCYIAVVGLLILTNKLDSGDPRANDGFEDDSNDHVLVNGRCPICEPAAVIENAETRVDEDTTV